MSPVKEGQTATRILVSLVNAIGFQSVQLISVTSSHKDREEEGVSGVK